MKEKLIRIAPILLIIAIAILAIVTLVTIGQTFFGANNGEQENQTETSQTTDNGSNLTKNEAGRSVKMVVRGPIVANEDFRSYAVEISQSKRTLITYKGYLKEEIKRVELANNADAYEQLINALDKANMMKGKQFSGKADDLLGVCATGHLYDFSILKDGNVEKHLWTSTCKGSKGSLLANTPQLQNLMISQIPDHDKVVKDLGIGEL